MRSNGTLFTSTAIITSRPAPTIPPPHLSLSNHHALLTPHLGTIWSTMNAYSKAVSLRNL